MPLRITCWGVALALGAADAWGTRFTMNPDGISYLDVSDAYWRGDWHNAINAYWSPLYSWILGFFLKVLKPLPYWEYPLVHLVNFVIYVVTLVCFEFFLATFITERRRRNQELLKHGQMGLSESSWWLLGYSLFLSSSLVLVGLHLVTPDLCESAFVYLASALILQIRVRTATHRTYATLGLVLGFAYLARSVMFPLGIVFLMTAMLADRRQMRWFAVTASIFLAISGSFVLLISSSKGRLTVGESGRWNYLVFINEVSPFFPQPGPPAQPPNQILKSPNVYDFSHTLPGTYPPWYDPSYWQDGIRAHLNLRNQWRVITRGARAYWNLVSDPFLHLGFILGLGFLGAVFHVRPKSSIGFEWTLLLPAAAALAAYALLLVEYRYIGPFVLLSWFAFFDFLRFRASPETQPRVEFTAACIAAAGLLVSLLWVGAALAQNKGPLYWEAAHELEQHGVRPGDPIALVWDDDWERGAVEGAFISRLLRSRIVAESEPAQVFWEKGDEVQRRVLDSLFATGATTVLARRPPARANVNSCWQELGRTEYYACTDKARSHRSESSRNK